MIAMRMTPEIVQAVRQPNESMSDWWIGAKATPPMPRPAAAMAVARPRLRMNHLASGTDVMSAPGPARPAPPMTMNSRTMAHKSPAQRSDIIATPMITAAMGSMRRAPCRSSSLPIKSAVSPPESMRAV